MLGFLFSRRLPPVTRLRWLLTRRGTPLETMTPLGVREFVSMHYRLVALVRGCRLRALRGVVMSLASAVASMRIVVAALMLGSVAAVVTSALVGSSVNVKQLIHVER